MQINHELATARMRGWYTYHDIKDKIFPAYPAVFGKRKQTKRRRAENVHQPAISGRGEIHKRNVESHREA